MTYKETIARLRAAGVPDAAIPAVMEMMDEREAEARRPRTSTERSRAYRERKTNADATKTLQERPLNVPEPLPERPADVAPALQDAPPRARVLYGEVRYTLEASASKGADAPLADGKIITPDQDLFRRGREVLGSGCGGQIAKLKVLFGGDVAAARKAVEQAALKDRPAEYIAAIIHKSGPNANMSRAGPDRMPDMGRNGKPTLSYFARKQDEKLNGCHGNDQPGSADEVRPVSDRLISGW